MRQATESPSFQIKLLSERLHVLSCLYVKEVDAWQTSKCNNSNVIIFIKICIKPWQAWFTEWIAEQHRSSVKISEHGKQRLHTLYMQDKSLKMKTSIYTYWKLGEPGRFKQLHNTASQALIDGANIWTAMWLYNFVLSENLASWILASQDSILTSWNSKRSSFETRGSSLEFRASSVNLLLSGTVPSSVLVSQSLNLSVGEVFVVIITLNLIFTCNIYNMLYWLSIRSRWVFFFWHFNSLRKRWIIVHFWETVHLPLQKCIMIQEDNIHPSQLKHFIFSPKRELSLVRQTPKILSA